MTAPNLSPHAKPPGGKRLRSKHVVLGAIAAAVLTICTCGAALSDDDGVCVDTSNNVIDPDDCDNDRDGARWYYGGHQSGKKMVGGSFDRGGFGRFFSGGS